MTVILMTIHIMLAVAMIALVLLQRTDQSGLGGLGGGGGGGGNFMSTRGQANLLSRTTAILFACFVVSSLVLVLLAQPGSNRPRSIADEVNPPAAPAQPAQPAVPLSR
ncbi:MAG: preprotein translocase subunit SecG [Alphaproteobacteria bacterium]|nr:preprotein translocase subunit SecG [Alphaproteobacteria bacterium]